MTSTYGIDKSHNEQTERVHPMVGVPEAIEIVLRETAIGILQQHDSSEVLSLAEKDTSVVGRVAAETVRMPVPGYPPYRASIMDGYAVYVPDEDKKSDKWPLQQEEEGEDWTHEVTGRLFAGDKVNAEDDDKNAADKEPSTARGFAVYVTTGAVVPAPYNAVVPVEDVVVVVPDRKIRIDGKLPNVGGWIRAVGCDIGADTVLVREKQVLDHAHVALLWQAGISQIRVQARPRVGVLSTGNELRNVLDPSLADAASDKTQIPDVNRPLLLSLLAEWSHFCVPVDLGVVGDDDAAGNITSRLQHAMETCQVIISTGGISMGEADVMENVLLQQLGCTLHFGRLHMKPGKPTTFLTKDNNEGGPRRFIFALPGNPVSAFVCSHLLARPCIALLARGGFSLADPRDTDYFSLQTLLRTAAPVLPEEVMAVLMNDNPIKLDMERPEYRRVQLSYDATRQQYLARHTGVQRSSRVLSLRGADGLLLLPQATSPTDRATRGQVYPVLLLRPFRQEGLTMAKSIHMTQGKLTVGLLHVRCRHDAEKETDNHAFRRHQVAETATLHIPNSKVVLQATIAVSAADSTEFQKALDSAIWPSIDILLVVIATEVPLALSWKVSHILRRRYRFQESDGMELAVRTAAAAAAAATTTTFAKAALCEVVAGLIRHDTAASMLLCLSQQGLEGGLTAMQPLWKHALATGRGLL